MGHELQLIAFPFVCKGKTSCFSPSSTSAPIYSVHRRLRPCLCHERRASALEAAAVIRPRLRCRPLLELSVGGRAKLAALCVATAAAVAVLRSPRQFLRHPRAHPPSLFTRIVSKVDRVCPSGTETGMEDAVAAAVTEERRWRQEPEMEEEAAADWVWSWGAGTDGQLGNGGFDDHHLPQPLLLPTRCRGRVSFVAGGGAHAIALTSEGEVFTWGRGTHGQLGHGSLDNIPHPKLVKFLEHHTITCVSAGWNHSGFVTDSGQLFMCGDGSFGQLGTGDNLSRNFPFEVTYFNARRIEKLAFGMRHSLVLLEDNSVYGFGSARRGQVGKCDSRNQKTYNVPRLIDGFPNCKIVDIYANGDHSAALDESGHLYIWGRALIGEEDDDQPRRILPSMSVSQVALGWHHALVLSAGELYKLGVYRHQKCDLPGLGNVSGQQSNTRETSSSHDFSISLSMLETVPFIDGEQVVQIASGTEHSALVTDKGTVFTWGWGEHGQLGLGDTLDHVVPQRVDIVDSGQRTSGSLAVYCGSGFTIAVKSP